MTVAGILGRAPYLSVGALIGWWIGGKLVVHIDSAGWLSSQAYTFFLIGTLALLAVGLVLSRTFRASTNGVRG